MIRLARRVGGALLVPRSLGEGDRRREVALNALLLASLMLAVVPGVQRTVQISQGGPDTADHFQTLAVVVVAGAMFGMLLWVSRRGRAALAAWGLLGVYYGVALWSAVAEGPAKGVTIVIFALFVVSAGSLCGSRALCVTVSFSIATLALVTVLDRTHVLSAPTEASQVPDAASLVELVAGFAVIALLLATRTGESSASVAELVADRSGSSPLSELRTGALSVRELQVARLVAEGRSNREISRDLIVSQRTVDSHVSSALRKTACSNRTELTLLMIREGLVVPGRE